MNCLTLKLTLDTRLNKAARKFDLTAFNCHKINNTSIIFFHPQASTHPMQRTHPILRSLISTSQLKLRCQPIQGLLAIQKSRRQISSKHPRDDLSNLSPLDNLHAARAEFARR